MAHIPHPPTTLLHTPTTTTRPPCLKMKKSSSLSTNSFLSHHAHNQRGGPSLRSILVLTALILYGLQSFLSHFNATVPGRSSYPTSTSSGGGSDGGGERVGSRTSFEMPFPTAESTHQRSGKSSRRKQQHTYSPQEQREQQTWYNDPTQHHQETSDDRTEFEKKYFSEPSSSYFPTSNDDDYDHDYDSYSSNYYNNYDTQQADTFDAYREYGAGTRQVLPGSECKGYYCAETGTCVDRPINCPCPHVLDTKCFRSDWFVCFRGPHKC